jgi:hypothetical protein
MTHDWVLGRYGALAAQPLTFGDIRHSVTIWKLSINTNDTPKQLTLMDGQVTAVTEDNSIRVLSFPVITYCTFGVFDREMRSRLWYPLALDVSGTLGGRRQSKTDQLEPLLLQFVHQDLEYFV